MNPQNDEEVLRKDYLLGKLSDQAREQVEERLLDDDDFVEQLATTEDNLIDDYVFGALSRSERKSFEKNFVINDERRSKLQLAQSLDRYLDKLDHPTQASPADSAPWWTTPLQVLRSPAFWIGVPALILLVLIAPRIVRWLKPNDQIAIVQAHRARIERQIAEFNRQSNTTTIPAHELALDPTPVLRDKGGIKRVTLSNDIKSLDLKLTVPSPAQENYRGHVLTLEGKELFTINDFTRENAVGGTVVRVKLPTDVLNTGDYQLQLGGVGPDGQLVNPVRYYFGLIKQDRNIATENPAPPGS